LLRNPDLEYYFLDFFCSLLVKYGLMVGMKIDVEDEGVFERKKGNGRARWRGRARRGGGGGWGWVAWVIGGFGTLFFGQFFFKSIRWLLALVWKP
jgi:hypothetical protein